MESETAKPNVSISIAREQRLIRLLMAYLITGLLFMVLPGTFLGVWNLFAISSAQSATSVPAAWIQAHGHAQLFGWIGSFILGIGFYSIPNLRRVSAWSFWEGWLTWTLWTAGVTLRWLTNVYLWQWRILLPLSAVLEVIGTRNHTIPPPGDFAELCRLICRKQYLLPRAAPVQCAGKQPCV